MHWKSSLAPIRTANGRDRSNTSLLPNSFNVELHRREFSKTQTTPIRVEWLKKPQVFQDLPCIRLRTHPSLKHTGPPAAQLPYCERYLRWFLSPWKVYGDEIPPVGRHLATKLKHPPAPFDAKLGAGYL
ncbi:hypothetical protein NMY22_g12421 [Coprinellus aureogranulatus]|nr:hypothetical protein NMY22_g12421 [Coprinellus aureogranulatus]